MCPISICDKKPATPSMPISDGWLVLVAPCWSLCMVVNVENMKQHVKETQECHSDLLEADCTEPTWLLFVPGCPVGAYAGGGRGACDWPFWSLLSPLHPFLHIQSPP